MDARTARSALRWAIRIALVGLCALVGFAITVLIVLPRATHGVALTVLTGSMTPDIPVGSVVIDRPVDPGTLHVGDIATYQKAPGIDIYITHRIVKIDTSTSPARFVFKGDANRGPDLDPVPAEAIRGKVWFHVPYLGAIRDSLQSHGTRGLALLAAIVALAVFGLCQVVAGLRGRGRPQSLVLRFAPGAFDGADPQIVAKLFGGECALDDEKQTATMTFDALPRRREVIGELLGPYQLAEDTPADAPQPQSPVEVSMHDTA